MFTGSVYILILIAVQNLLVPLGGVDGHAAHHIGNMLCYPDGEPQFITLVGLANRRLY